MGYARLQRMCAAVSGLPVNPLGTKTDLRSLYGGQGGIVEGGDDDSSGEGDATEPG